MLVMAAASTLDSVRATITHTRKRTILMKPNGKFLPPRCSDDNFLPAPKLYMQTKEPGKCKSIIEPPHDKTNEVACAPSEDSDQPGHPLSLSRVFAVRMKKPWVLSYPLSAQ